MTASIEPRVARSGPAPDAGPVLEARNVTRYFTGRSSTGQHRTIRALEDCTVRLYPGRILALVGESGSGKTTVARVLGLFYPPTSGEILLDGESVRTGRRNRGYYSRVQMIMQDPFSSLNSLKRLRHILGRVLTIHRKAKGRAAVETRVVELLERVNLTPGAQWIDKYPGELSGGQRQRVAIARALAVEPTVLLADEPTSMLDASIRLDVLNLLRQLRDRSGLAMLFITHDIASARYLSDDIQVMYAGQTVEGGPTEPVITEPLHPYTRLLVESASDPARYKRAGHSTFDEESVVGEPPDPGNPPAGCRFSPRCPRAMDVCRTTVPPRTEHGDRWVHCWLYDDVDDGPPDSATRHTPSRASGPPPGATPSTTLPNPTIRPLRPNTEE